MDKSITIKIGEVEFELTKYELKRAKDHLSAVMDKARQEHVPLDLEKTWGWSILLALQETEEKRRKK